MLGAEHASLSAGRHALAWVLGQTDLWYFLYRCAHYVSKSQTQQTHQSSVSILNDLFMVEDQAERGEQPEENDPEQGKQV